MGPYRTLHVLSSRQAPPPKSVHDGERCFSFVQNTGENKFFFFGGPNASLLSRTWKDREKREDPGFIYLRVELAGRQRTRSCCGMKAELNTSSRPPTNISYTKESATVKSTRPNGMEPTISPTKSRHKPVASIPVELDEEPSVKAMPCAGTLPGTSSSCNRTTGERSHKNSQTHA